jgi:hypothetical protein
VAYIGNEPVIGQWRKLDDISGSFNGSLTSFTTQVGGTNVTAGSANQLLVSLGGVLQEPGTDYSVSSSTITFTTAPAASLSFFAVLAGDALNTSVPADGSITTAKLGANLTVDLDLGSAASPSLTFDADSGLFSGGDNQVAVSTSGVERVEFGASEVVFNDGGADYDFRVEGDTDANLLFVDASTDRIGVGTASPAADLHVNAASGDVSGRWSSTANTVITYLAGTGDTVALQFGDVNDSNIGAIRYENSDDSMVFVANNAGRLTLDSSGRVLIGTAANLEGRQVQSATTGGNNYGAYRFSNGAGGCDYWLYKSRGVNIGDHGAALENDIAGTIQFALSDGVNYVRCASIQAAVDSPPGSADMPGRLEFATTLNNNSTPVERLRITHDGFVRLQTSGAGIQFNGDTSSENSLDDYEEGTFANPEIVPSSGSFSSVTYQADTAAKYIKIGQIVHYWGTVRWTAFSVGTGSGTLRVTAPFQVASRENGDDSDNVGATIVPVWGGTSTAVPTTIQAQNGLARCILRATRHDAVSNTLLVSDVGNTGMVAFSLTYKTP